MKQQQPQEVKKEEVPVKTPVAVQSASAPTPVKGDGGSVGKKEEVGEPAKGVASVPKTPTSVVE